MQKRINQSQGGSPKGRSAPQGMPREVASHSRAPKQIEQKRDLLPAQKPVTDEGDDFKQPSKIRRFLQRLSAGIMLVLALGIVYIFLLIGEPAPEALPPETVREEKIQVPMAALEAGGGGDLSTVAINFGKPLLVMQGQGLTLEKVALSDTAFQGGYARRATLTYRFLDGQTCTLESIRPTMAAELLSHDDGSLYAADKYRLAGMEAARLDGAADVRIFGEGAEAAYAVVLPREHRGEVDALLRQAVLLTPGNDGP